ncbi:uncharacterized protein KGF55_002681 [Candida pseudojiufengensis]|uniref:uncharacterized protein n=1 Tax=Candida pseudojiufengensis TaxID=497109 RepID=UPI0022255FFB|nr:uncharacterized protein KGF55_002681 [Candida pseudojiufengensis]KAI5963801.1 hypothetical protein KGF55_002681 [Candida pseudojiufengensis]
MAFVSSSLMKQYINSLKFKTYVLDWIVALILALYFFLIAEHAKPFNRQFSIDDLTISHPFAIKERVSGPACIIIASLLPSTVIASILAFKHFTGKVDSKLEMLHTFQISILGLTISIFLDGIITDILKNWIARPRPDFLARCGVSIENRVNSELLDISVCTAPYGQVALIDGMRSTPSGHSSISFVAFLYLSLWLLGQFKLISITPQPIYKYLLAFSPLLLASYIALSRAQDYRHHFIDLILGSILGCIIAWFVYHHYWNNIFSKNCDSPKFADENEESILPR